MIVKQEQFGSMSNNAFLIVDEKTNQSALIDCPEYNEKMEKLIGDTDLKYILLTHGHYDHILGVNDVKKRFGAKVVISKEDEPMLSSSKLSLAAFVGVHQDKAEADEIIKDGDVINLGDTQIKVMATPGHTKGCVCYIADDAVFTGDTLFYCSCGRTDFPGGDEYEMLDSLHKLRDLEGVHYVYTGHDNNSTLPFERENNRYMNM